MVTRKYIDNLKDIENDINKRHELLKVISSSLDELIKLENGKIANEDIYSSKDEYVECDAMEELKEIENHLKEYSSTVWKQIYIHNCVLAVKGE